MSVMIIGMNIPKCCYDCPLSGSSVAHSFFMGCSVTGESFDWEETGDGIFSKKRRENFDKYSERLKSCPMIDMGRQNIEDIRAI